MENRKLNQIVFVIMDNYENKVVGVYNDYTEATQVAEAAEKDFYGDEYITITPVLVDTVNIVPDSRKLYYTEQGVVDALQEELDLAMPYVEEEEEEEEEEWTPCDDCYHPYACEKCDFNTEDEEADPIEKMLFIHEGKVTISEKDAMEITHQMAELIEEQGEGLTASQKTIWLHDALTALAKDYGIEYVLDV